MQAIVSVYEDDSIVEQEQVAKVMDLMDQVIHSV